jgi:hypothetical protein
LKPVRISLVRPAARLVIKAAMVALVCGVFWRPAYAGWDFEPTEAEWLSWPLYCRVQYTGVNPGFRVETFRSETFEHFRRTIGEGTFSGLHHWCASIHFRNRARVERDPAMRDFVLRRALADAIYSFVRAEQQSPVYPDMAITLAQIHQDMGKPQDAYAALQKSIEAQPTRSEPYVLLAIMHRKAHHLERAWDVLRQADQVTGGMSAEIQYNLGLINLERGDVTAAVGNAHQAYRLGYPLPGLKNNLRKLGKWSIADEQAANTPLAAEGAAKAP